MIPRGIEILVKKASVDSKFRRHLLAERADAAVRIGLELTPAEADMLSSIPQSQLIAIIGNTRVSPRLRPAFMGYAATAMLATIGIAVVNTSADANSLPEAEVETDEIILSYKPLTSRIVLVQSVDIANPDIKPIPDTGSVNGYVKDENGVGVSGALVVVKSAFLFDTTNSLGYFVINEVPVGDYDIKASSVGFSESTISTVEISELSLTTVAFYLDSTIRSSVTITGIGPLLDFSKSYKERNIDDRDIENQTGDDIDDFIKFVPGVVYE